MERRIYIFIINNCIRIILKMDYIHSVWNYLASICNCWQCTEDTGAQVGHQLDFDVEFPLSLYCFFAFAAERAKREDTPISRPREPQPGPPEEQLGWPKQRLCPLTTQERWPDRSVQIGSKYSHVRSCYAPLLFPIGHQFTLIGYSTSI